VLDSHEIRRNIMPLERTLELILGNLSICRQGGSVVTPPNTCRSLQLMESILHLHHFYHLEHTKLLLESVQPFICLEWLIHFLEDRRLHIQKILEITILTWF
jgi:hypothetical protein